MRFFHNLSIKTKETIILLVTSGISLLLACAAFVGYDRLHIQKELSQQVAVLADVVGRNCAAAIDFNDAGSATETLGAFRIDPHIVMACILSKDGKVFAMYKEDSASRFSPPAAGTPGEEFTGDQFQLFRPISFKGEVIGNIFVVSDLKHMSNRLWQYLGIATIVFAASFLAALALASRLQRVVCDPILEISRVVRRVAEEKNYSVRVKQQSQDELGQFALGFNEMLDQIQTRDSALQAAHLNLERRVEERTRELEAIHKQLLHASRQAGMAEIATNVLHNVGNVLNSVNVSTELIAASVKKSKAPNLARVVGLLQERAQDLAAFISSDARGKNIPVYLAQLSEQLAGEQAAILKELDSLRKNIEHIIHIVAMQQGFAVFGGLPELARVKDIVEDSIRMNEDSLQRHQVTLVREIEDTPPVQLEKHKLLQILTNLLRNAGQACQAAGRPDMRVTVRVARVGDRVRISIADNGIGISAENLPRIFSFGFTTRKEGHGFGLHSAALAAKEMGASLSVQSDGPEPGATFTIELPCPAGEKPHE